MIVVDASIILAWLLPDERDNAAAEEIVTRAKRSGAIAPPLLPLEVANALRSNVRRARIDAGYRDQALALLASLAVAQDLECRDATVLHEIVRLSEVHDLTAYDAAYLEVAIRHQAPLGTLDEALRRSAKAEGVAVLP